MEAYYFTDVHNFTLATFTLQIYLVYKNFNSLFHLIHGRHPCLEVTLNLEVVYHLIITNYSLMNPKTTPGEALPILLCMWMCHGNAFTSV